MAKHAFLKLFIFGVIMCCLIKENEGSYRKPPFNGSIFGKRSSTIDYDSTGRALAALCDIASETCQAWYQALDNK